MGAFQTATETFLKSAVNLGDADMPLVVALQETAREIDTNGVNASLVNQYRLTYIALSEKAFGDDEEVDPLEALLS